MSPSPKWGWQYWLHMFAMRMRSSVCEAPYTMAGTQQTFKNISLLAFSLCPRHISMAALRGSLRPPLPRILPMGRIFWDVLTWRRLPICVQHEKSKRRKARAQYHFSPGRRCRFHSDPSDSSLFSVSWFLLQAKWLSYTDLLSPSPIKSNCYLFSWVQLELPELFFLIPLHFKLNNNNNNMNSESILLYIHDLEQWFSKGSPWTPGDCETHSLNFCKVKTLLTTICRFFCLFYCADICINGIKAMVSETSTSLAWI